jgi:hypothetical protein
MNQKLHLLDVDHGGELEDDLLWVQAESLTVPASELRRIGIH